VALPPTVHSISSSSDVVLAFLRQYVLTGQCSGGTGVVPEVFWVSSPQKHGGTCPYNNGTTRETTTCTNSNPCPPPNCAGAWQDNGACSATCGGGAGVLPELYIVSRAAGNGGTDCPFANGTTRATTSCTNNDPCPPQDCVGAWQGNGLCDGACGGGSGVLPEVFIVTTEAAHGGNDCPVSNGTTRAQTPCTTAPCPVDCAGSFVAPDSSMCSGSCGSQGGCVPERFVITQAAAHGGADCAYADGAPRCACMICIRVAFKVRVSVCKTVVFCSVMAINSAAALRADIDSCFIPAGARPRAPPALALLTAGETGCRQDPAMPPVKETVLCWRSSM
jgi:hypothetical protein